MTSKSPNVEEALRRRRQQERRKSIHIAVGFSLLIFAVLIPVAMLAYRSGSSNADGGTTNSSTTILIATFALLLLFAFGAGFLFLLKRVIAREEIDEQELTAAELVDRAAVDATLQKHRSEESLEARASSAGRSPAPVGPRSLVGLEEEFASDPQATVIRVDEPESPETVVPAADGSTLSEPGQRAADTPTVIGGGDVPPAHETAAVSTAAPLRLGDYELLAEIGRGGMGRVYRARHLRMGRIVALKTILADAAMRPGAVARFQAEIRSVARLDHPGIVPVYEAGEAEGQQFFTMALIDGESLAERLRMGRLEPQRAAFVVGQAAEAVGFAHRMGVIHRDIKPGNILLERDGSIRVADFGLARQLDAEDVAFEAVDSAEHADPFQTVARLTMTGAILGTPAYMAPEQVIDTKRTRQSADIWALGAVLYASLTGRPPFVGSTAMETLHLVSTADPQPIREINREVDSELEAICFKCLSKDPVLRYASGDELAADLVRWRTGRVPLAVREGRFDRVRIWDKNFPEALPLTAFILVPWFGGPAEAAFVGAAMMGMRRSERRPSFSSLVAAACIAMLVIGIPLVWVTAKGLPPQTPVQVSYWVATCLNLIACALAGVTFRWGDRAALERRRQGTYRVLLMAALIGAVITWLVFPVLRQRQSELVDLTSRTAFAIRGLSRWLGPASGALMTAALGFGLGVQLRSLADLAGQGLDAGTRKRLDLVNRMSVAAAAGLTLFAAAVFVVPGPPIALDLSGYFGPGPLLTSTEHFLGRCGLAASTCFPVVFLLKLMVLSIPMVLAAGLPAWISRTRTNR